jgi:chaperonin GroEL (HSP60 family)
VVRSALQHAASIGALMITTEAMVAEPQKARAGNGSSHGMDDTGY